MNRRKRYSGPAHPEWWEVHQTYRRGRTELTRGRELKIQGVRGQTFRFWDYVVVPPHGDKTEPVEWITVTGETGFRSFRPDRISRVLRQRTEGQRSR